MKFRTICLISGLFFTIFSGIQNMAQSEDSGKAAISRAVPDYEKLVILWTSGDREVALKMVFMYTYNAKTREWFDDITLVV